MGSGLSKHPSEGGEAPEPLVKPTVSSKPVAEPADATASSTNANACPMHNADGSYSYDIRQLWGAVTAHSTGGTKPLSVQQQKDGYEKMKKGECPVKHDDEAAKNPEGGCPVKHEAKAGGCPVKHDDKSTQFNVYGQAIDPTNQMPSSNRNQLPAHVQTMELSTDRVRSNIPKGGTDGDSWTYPSPQMFYNALVRKGKAEPVEETDANLEGDMASVVALHNHMNEKTWRRVLEWETQLGNPAPKLLKFQGRPHDLSPKAWLKHYLLGHPLPYDRHDWIVVRPDQTTVRYVIDYYFDDQQADDSESSAMPHLSDPDAATSSLLVDARPALDAPSLLYHRAITMPMKYYSGDTNFEYLPMRASVSLQNQVSESIQVWQSIQKMRDEKAKDRVQEIQPLSPDQVKEWAASLKSCAGIQKQLEACTDDSKLETLSLDYTLCLGKRMCGVQHGALVKALSSDDESQVEHALESITACVALTSERAGAAKS